MKIGVLGGGQLGRMLGLAGLPLGFSFRFLDPSTDAGAGAVGELVTGDFEDANLLDRFAAGLDVVTLEWENVPLASAERLAARLPFYPPPAALAVAQDRLAEKELFARLDIETAAYLALEAAADLPAALAQLGLPALLKTRRLGYDGRGQWRIDTPADVAAAATGLSAPCLLERVVPFDRELSIIAARSWTGEVVFYPLVENHHRQGILRVSFAPAPAVSQALQAQAEALAASVLEALDYVGVITIELFDLGGRLLANEIAPRVHNSGHWSIEGAPTSQFANHLRAIAGLPLGTTTPTRHSLLVNLVGEAPPSDTLLLQPGLHLHLYDKEPRPGRKLGHLTLVASEAPEFETAARRLLALVGEDVRLPLLWYDPPVEQRQLAMNPLEDEEVELLLAAYDAFNRRDLSAALALLHAEVDWPNLLDGGVLHGRDEVRAYWQRQLQSTDPHVEPTAFMRESEQVIASVHETVRDIGGELLREADALHVYSFADGLIAAMVVVTLDDTDIV